VFGQLIAGPEQINSIKVTRFRQILEIFSLPLKPSFSRLA
jgi:hypothetical protein